MPTLVGPIVRLQIQTGALKVGEKPHRRYEPRAIASVRRIRLTREGVTGLGEAAATLDAHHQQHPLRKNDDGGHGVSVGFTSHYGLMRRRFGPHLIIGCAGENIIVETDRRVELADVAAGMLLLDARGREKGRLVNVEVAHPCRPFTGFALAYGTVAPEVLRDSLVFLDGGMRGFYATFSGPDEGVVIEPGDGVGVIGA